MMEKTEQLLKIRTKNTGSFTTIQDEYWDTETNTVTMREWEFISL
jgi:hypothetical protein